MVAEPPSSYIGYPAAFSQSFLSGYKAKREFNISSICAPRFIDPRAILSSGEW